MMHLEADVFRKFDKQWALVTAGTPEHYNTMTISWGGLGTLWRRPVATVYVKKNRYTFEFMEQSDYFTVSFYPEAQRRALSLLGSTSGRDGDKVAALARMKQSKPKAKLPEGQASLDLDSVMEGDEEVDLGDGEDGTIDEELDGVDDVGSDEGLE